MPEKEAIEQSISDWVVDAATRLRQDPDDAAKRARVVARFLHDQGVRRLDDLSAPGLMAWLAGQARTKKPRTVRNRLAAIRQWSRYLEASGKIERAPFESVKVAKCVSDDGCDPLDGNQASALLENARKDLSAAHHGRRRSATSRLVAYHLMLDAGLRVNEVRQQLWSDIDLDRMLLRVSQDKAGRKDVVPISRKTAAAIRLHRIKMVQEGVSTDRLMFLGGPNAKTMRTDLTRAGCGDEPGRFHRLRKHAVTERAKRGLGMWQLAAFARHRDPKTTMRYVRLNADDLRLA